MEHEMIAIATSTEIHDLVQTLADLNLRISDLTVRWLEGAEDRVAESLVYSAEQLILVVKKLRAILAD